MRPLSDDDGGADQTLLLAYVLTTMTMSEGLADTGLAAAAAAERPCAHIAAGTSGPDRQEPAAAGCRCLRAAEAGMPQHRHVTCPFAPATSNCSCYQHENMEAPRPYCLYCCLV